MRFSLEGPLGWYPVPRYCVFFPAPPNDNDDGDYNDYDSGNC